MNILIAPSARRDLARQFDFLIERGSAPAARRLEQRLSHFIERTLAAHPRAGIYLTHRDLWETWVPRTRFVIWYRFTQTELQIVRTWHTSQDRRRSP